MHENEATTITNQGKEMPGTVNKLAQDSSKRLLWFLIIPLVLGTAGVPTLLSRRHTEKVLATTTTAASAEAVDVLHAQTGELTEDLVLPATLQGYDNSPLYARVNGYVSKWYTDIGEHVHQGQLMATISAPDVDQQLLMARATLSQAHANLTLAETTTKRYLELIKTNSVAQQAVDQNNQNLLAQQASVASASAAVQQLEQDQGFERVVAPFDGIVTERRTDVGDLVNSGNSGVNAELFRVSKVNVVRVFVTVPEQYSEQVRDGMHVTVKLTELPNESFEGTVTRSDHAIDPNSRTLLAEVDVPNPQGKLMPGAYGEVQFHLANPTRPLVLPSGSILYQAAGPQVALVNSKQQIELRKVALGRDMGNTIEVTSGITQQDSIVANPPDYLVDGMPVTVQNAGGNGKKG